MTRHPKAQAGPRTVEDGGTSIVHLTLDGQELLAHPGQTVGAALIDAGIQSWRTTRKNGRPRGLFCGIGICYDCLITVDGAPNQRACLVPVREGMQLSTTAAPVGAATDAPNDGGTKP
ncbi:(2Fe-2S)-binding protein [Nocardia sp. NPDC005998]|uniref:(2Fe-2S)-binding protein n=1 Tax=Nocardia sp. NPDC005998 TaxID=3156894 RepID=UPI0033BCF4EC